MNGYRVLGALPGESIGQQYNNLAASMGDCVKATDESPLSRDMRCITEAIARLDNELTYLRDKLSPVTLAEAPQVKGETANQVPIPNRSTYGYNLRDHERQIHAMADAVNSLRNRLEV
jgi:hypothetical protein